MEGKKNGWHPRRLLVLFQHTGKLVLSDISNRHIALNAIAQNHPLARTFPAENAVIKTLSAPNPLAGLRA